ncbi:MAG: adenylyltransferase/cytidyltransferase family protein, partial [Candidatus Hydrogenedentes bacterium]|nr:adenylyltransferase/cytidyltransferase family protein [Candidatus Hydrogenedentota bacterium]
MMHVFNDVTTCTCSFLNLVLTIGSFDGFHRGHQYILEEVTRIAKERGGTSGLMTLCPNPKAFFNPESRLELLTVAAEKEALLEAAGLDAYFVLPFDEHVAQIDRASFLRDIVLGRCGARCLVVGHDFSFGAGARGDFAYLSDV